METIKNSINNIILDILREKGGNKFVRRDVLFKDVSRRISKIVDELAENPEMIEIIRQDPLLLRVAQKGVREEDFRKDIDNALDSLLMTGLIERGSVNSRGGLKRSAQMLGAYRIPSTPKIIMESLLRQKGLDKIPSKEYAEKYARVRGGGKIYVGQRGGLYYKKGGKKVYLK